MKQVLLRFWSKSKNSIFALVASFGGLLFGYNATILALVLPAAAKDWNLSMASQHLLSGAFFLGAILGALFIGKFIDLVGRRDVIMTSAAVYAFSSFACTLSSMFEELLIARFFVGLMVGVTSLAIPLYIAEISHARNRGAMVSFNQMGITFGILLAFVLEENGWVIGHGANNLYTIGGVLAVFVSMGAIILPESPAWLVKQGDDEAALRVLRRLRKPHAVQEIADIKKELAEKDRNFLVDLFKPSNAKLLIIGIGLFAIQQLSGINFILLSISSPTSGYANLSFITDAIPGLDFVILVGLVNLASTILFVLLVDRLGRRPLLLAGMAGLAGCLGLLIFQIAQPAFFPVPASWEPLILVGYTFFFAISLGPIPWLFVAEFYPLAVRGISMSVPITVNWILNALMVLVSISIHSPKEFLNVYILSLIATLLGIGFCYFLFPESKKLSFKELHAKWHQAVTSPEKNEILASLATIVVTIGGILFGYNLTVVAGVLLAVEDMWSLSPLTSGLVVSSVLVGAMVGSIVSGDLAAAFGRRYLLMTTTVVFIVGSAVSGLSNTVTFLVIGRLVTGLALGVTASIVPLYISEISPAPIRGKLNSLLHLSVVIGALIAYAANTFFISQTDGWRHMLYLGSVPALVMGIGILFLPESPRWLISKGQLSTARLMLQKLYVTDPDGEIAVVQKNVDNAPNKRNAGSLLSPAIRPALFIGLALMFFQECTGINILSYYGPTIFQAGGVESPTVASFLTTIGVGVINLLVTLLSFKLVDKLGRRPLFIIGISGIVLSSLSFGIVFLVVSSGVAALKYAVLACFMIFVASFSLSLGSVCGIMKSEIYPQSVRDRAIGLVTAFNVFCAILVSLTFLKLVDSVGLSVTFFLNAGIAALGIPFWYYYMPETKGKTLEEIEQHWLEGKSPAAMR
jgi:sugar porter (SP) family MFS transporter